MRQAAVALALLVLGVFAANGRTASAPPCAANRATAEYTGYIQRAVDSGRDLWGHELLAARGGPTLHAAEGRLAPLLFGVQRKLRPLTPSGFYYVPLSFSWSNYGSTVFALHVADGYAGDYIDDHYYRPVGFGITSRADHLGPPDFPSALLREAAKGDCVGSYFSLKRRCRLSPACPSLYWEKMPAGG